MFLYMKIGILGSGSKSAKDLQQSGSGSKSAKDLQQSDLHGNHSSGDIADSSHKVFKK